MNKPHNKARKMVLNSGTWWYLIGTSYIIIWSPEPDRVRHRATRHRWDDDHEVAATPSNVRSYIEKVILGDDPEGYRLF